MERLASGYYHYINFANKHFDEIKNLKKIKNIYIFEICCFACNMNFFSSEVKKIHPPLTNIPPGVIVMEEQAAAKERERLYCKAIRDVLRIVRQNRDHHRGLKAYLMPGIRQYKLRFGPNPVKSDRFYNITLFRAFVRN